jgi:hypothetical protein
LSSRRCGARKLAEAALSDLLGCPLEFEIPGGIGAARIRTPIQFRQIGSVGGATWRAVAQPFGGGLAVCRRYRRWMRYRVSVGECHRLLHLKLPGWASFAPEGGRPATFEKGLGVEVPEDFDQGRHQTGPSGLMAGADPGAVVAMEIFVE